MLDFSYSMIDVKQYVKSTGSKLFSFALNLYTNTHMLMIPRDPLLGTRHNNKFLLREL